MRLPESTITISGDLEFEAEFDMDIDPAAKAMVLEHLIRQYTAPYVATLREHTSNAYDAHVDAGQTRPVEVTLPSVLTPNLVIQDWGVGMDFDTLKSYAQFGASSKRDNDETAGGYGIGSKSALAIATQFTVTSVKDGLRNVVIIGRNEQGALKISFISVNEATDQPNGTKVTIPATDASQFTRAISGGLFDGWPMDSILINGKAPDVSVFNTDYYEDLDGLGWLSFKRVPSGVSDLTGRGRLSVATVPIDWTEVFPNDEPFSEELFESYLQYVTLNLPNGGVTPQRSREGLTYDERTLKVIRELAIKIIDRAKAKVQKDIDAAPNHLAALKIKLEAAERGFTGKYTYKSSPVGFPEYSPKDNRLVSIATITSQAERPRKAEVYGSLLRSMSEHQLARWVGSKSIILVTGCQKKTWEHEYRLPTHDEVSNLRPFLTAKAEELNPESYGNIRRFTTIFTDKPLNKLSPWFTALFQHQFTAAEFEAIAEDQRKSERKEAADIRKARQTKDLKFRVVYGPGGYGGAYTDEVDPTDMDTTKDYILLKSGMSDLTDLMWSSMSTKANYSSYLSALVSRFLSNYKFLYATKATSTKEYGSILPNLYTLEEALQKEISKIDVAFTAEQIAALGDRTGWTTVLSTGAYKKINRPETRQWIETMYDEATAQRLTSTQILLNAVSNVRFYLKDITIPELPDHTSIVSPSQRYPLLEGINPRVVLTDEIINYINYKDSQTP